ncbi:MAG: hypothetical protein SGJ27_27655 [Candidatus Melainabacteria bacterium]|nr:hypothetical protein [Candidatus Melainabacteria bacterium]
MSRNVIEKSCDRDLSEFKAVVDNLLQAEPDASVRLVLALCALFTMIGYPCSVALSRIEKYIEDNHHRRMDDDAIRKAAYGALYSALAVRLGKTPFWFFGLISVLVFIAAGYYWQ